MNIIVQKDLLCPDIGRFEINAPRIARVWKAGQFIIVRPNSNSERIPLTLVGGNVEKGTITLVVLKVGKTTTELLEKQEGDAVCDLVGPLGEPANTEHAGHVLCVAGGVGVAEVLPVAEAFVKAGNRVTVLCGARSKERIILDAELRATGAHQIWWATDDRSAGYPGTVVDLMRFWREGCNEPLGLVHIIGPITMMKYAALLTKEWGVTTYASLNPVMIDGTGMCGGCRVTVDGKARFACVDGPEFDAHAVDFDELMRRNKAYLAHEVAAMQKHACRLNEVK